jgi:FixJ family two-component response regulator
MSEQNRNSVSPTVDAAPAPLLAKKLRVLAVDDSENDLHLLTRALSRVRSWSVDLKTCSTPHEFLAAVECRANDLLFIDHRLGAVTGLQLLKTIRDTGSTVPAIFLTGIGDERVAVEVMQAGACDYLPKEDLSAARLERAIDGALDRHRREMEEVEKVERLEHERQDLQTKSEEMEDHYRGSSLDLTTPLSMVTEILSEIRRGAPGPLTHDQIELLDAASEGCARIARGMDDLLGVGRLAGGPVSLWIRREDLATLVEHARPASRRACESAGIRLEVHTTPGMPPAAVDRMRVHQVLANLVDLALERVPANGRIEIEARQDECDPVSRSCRSPIPGRRCRPRTSSASGLPVQTGGLGAERGRDRPAFPRQPRHRRGSRRERRHREGVVGRHGGVVLAACALCRRPFLTPEAGAKGRSGLAGPRVQEYAFGSARHPRPTPRAPRKPPDDLPHRVRHRRFHALRRRTREPAPAQTPCQGSTGPDVIVGDITGPRTTARQARSRRSRSARTSCNQGTATLGWHANTNQHPVIGGELYRYKVVNGAGRFEQVGLSWLKHGFFARASTLCCTDCQARRSDASACAARTRTPRDATARRASSARATR